jgi:hypothetical protein
VEGGGGVTLRDEYFPGGGSKRRFTQEEKLPFTFLKRHLRDFLIPLHRRCKFNELCNLPCEAGQTLANHYHEGL